MFLLCVYAHDVIRELRIIFFMLTKKKMMLATYSNTSILSGFLDSGHPIECLFVQGHGHLEHGAHIGVLYPQHPVQTIHVAWNHFHNGAHHVKAAFLKISKQHGI